MPPRALAQLVARIETQLRLRDGWMAEIEAVRSNELLDQVRGSLSLSLTLSLSLSLSLSPSLPLSLSLSLSLSISLSLPRLGSRPWSLRVSTGRAVCSGAP